MLVSAMKAAVALRAARQEGQESFSERKLKMAKMITRNDVAKMITRNDG